MQQCNTEQFEHAQTSINTVLSCCCHQLCVGGQCVYHNCTVNRTWDLHQDTRICRACFRRLGNIIQGPSHVHRHNLVIRSVDDTDAPTAPRSHAHGSNVAPTVWHNEVQREPHQGQGGQQQLPRRARNRREHGRRCRKWNGLSHVHGHVGNAQER